MSTLRGLQGTQADLGHELGQNGASTWNVPTELSKPNQHITPRNSIADEDMAGKVSAAAGATETPYNTLRHLSNIIPKPSTPLRRASSAGPPSTRRSTRRTPAVQDRTPGLNRKATSFKKPNVSTPYVRAALRQAEMNRVATLTPAKDRRQSGRHLYAQQRQDRRHDKGQDSALLVDIGQWRGQRALPPGQKRDEL